MINPKMLTFSPGQFSLLFSFNGQCPFTLHFNEAETVVFVDRYNKVAVAAL